MDSSGGSGRGEADSSDTEAYVERQRERHRGQTAHCLACGYEADVGRWGWVATTDDGDTVAVARCPACETPLPR